MGGAPLKSQEGWEHSDVGDDKVSKVGDSLVGSASPRGVFVSEEP